MSETFSSPVTIDPPHPPGQVLGCRFPLPLHQAERLAWDAETHFDHLDLERSDGRLVATPSPYFRVKQIIESVVTVGLLVACIPLVVFVASLIVVTQGRPVFYRQTRVGKWGKPFQIWKFRSMKCDAEKDTGATWSGKEDPRVTAIGRWLRCSHVDELPQLMNVLAGDMSLIGPRPERPEFVRELSREVPDYTERLRVRPGMTGLAQLGVRYDHCVNDVRRKVELDLHYIKTASLLGDLRLLLETTPYIAGELIQNLRLRSRVNRPTPNAIRSLVTAQSITNADSRSLDQEYAA